MIREDAPLALSSTATCHLIASALRPESETRGDHIRVDGRAAGMGRPVSLSLRRQESMSTAELSMGRTVVLADVTAELTQPFPGRPSEGMLQFRVDNSALVPTSGREAGRPSPAALELDRAIEWAVRDSQALDTEALCVISGEHVWSVRVEVCVLNDDGNLIDACVLAAMAALRHFRRPEVTVVTSDGVGDCAEEVIAGESWSGSSKASSRTNVSIHKDDDKPPLLLPLHHVPLAVTFGIIKDPLLSICLPTATGSSALPLRSLREVKRPDGRANLYALLDPCAREEFAMAGRVTLFLNAHRELCAVQKLGGATLVPEHLVTLSLVAARRAADLHAWLTLEAEAADAKASTKRTARLRGRSFQNDVKLREVGDTGKGSCSVAVSHISDAVVAHLNYDDLQETFITRNDDFRMGRDDGEEEEEEETKHERKGQREREGCLQREKKNGPSGKRAPKRKRQTATSES